MSKNWQDMSCALSGVFQAAAQVEQLAKTGCAPQSFFRPSIESLFQQNPESTLAVFGELPQLQLGLSVLSDLLHHHRNQDYGNTLRYVLGILHLQKKLARDKNMLSTLSTRLEQAKQQSQHFDDSLHDNVIANLADIYSATLSTFNFRIQVIGDSNYLQQTRTANQIRALLFAGVRAATLWHQLGGRRWHLLFNRKQLCREADQLLQQIPQL